MQNHMIRRHQQTPHSSSSSAEEDLPSSSPESSTESMRYSVILLNPTLSDVLEFWWGWTCTCFEVWRALLTVPQFSELGLMRLSIILVLCHHADVLMDDYIQLQQEQKQQQYDPMVFPHAWHYTLPLNTTAWWLGMFVMVSGLLLVLLVAALPSQEETLMATALVSLFYIEAMLPLLVVGGAAMWALKQVSWVSSLVFLGLVWVMVMLLAHLVRCRLFQSMGHG